MQEDKELETMELDELLNEVEAVEQDFRLGKIGEDEVAEFMKKVAKILNISTESG
jgi:hypothetical protein